MEFNINDWREEQEQKRKNIEIEAENKLMFLVVELKKAGVEEVEIQYYGSGDDGSIDYVQMNPQPENKQDLEDKLENWAYDFLEGTGENIWDNDGGRMNVVLDLKNNLMKYSIHQNEMIENLVQEDEVNL